MVQGSARFREENSSTKPKPEYLLDDRSLAKWETSDPENQQGLEVLRIARHLIKVANSDVVPTVADPFAGGGAIPLEALRLGCNAVANTTIIRSHTSFFARYLRIPTEVWNSRTSTNCQRKSSADQLNVKLWSLMSSPTTSKNGRGGFLSARAPEAGPHFIQRVEMAGRY